VIQSAFENRLGARGAGAIYPGGARAPHFWEWRGHGGHRGRTFNYHNLL